MGDNMFDDAVGSIESSLRRMRKAWAEIVDHVEWGIRFLPGSVAGQVRRSTQKLDAEYHKTDRWVTDYLLERGSPAALRAAAGRWDAQVGTVTSTQLKELAFAAMPSNGRWTGPAQLAYRSILEQQNKALADLKTTVEDASSTVTDVADAVKEFWIAAAAILLSGAMVVCALETIGIVTIPEAIKTAIAAVALFWAGVGVAVILVDNALDDADAKLERLATRMGEDATWPKATADITDSSVLDEDGTSEWEPIP